MVVRLCMCPVTVLLPAEVSWKKLQQPTATLFRICGVRNGRMDNLRVVTDGSCYVCLNQSVFPQLWCSAECPSSIAQWTMAMFLECLYIGSIHFFLLFLKNTFCPGWIPPALVFLSISPRRREMIRCEQKKKKKWLCCAVTMATDPPSRASTLPQACICAYSLPDAFPICLHWLMHTP